MFPSCQGQNRLNDNTSPRANEWLRSGRFSRVCMIRRALFRRNVVSRAKACLVMEKRQEESIFAMISTAKRDTHKSAEMLPSMQHCSGGMCKKARAAVMPTKGLVIWLCRGKMRLISPSIASRRTNHSRGFEEGFPCHFPSGGTVIDKRVHRTKWVHLAALA